ncbi:hypothetical protein RUND412_011550, partial [Rhizina undulata]
MFVLVCGLYLLGLFHAATVHAADATAWSTRSIYFVLTDRFAKTSSSTTACSDLSNYCGGTWAGMEAKLDYIQDLGFDAIWITPIVENVSGGYHGYWALDIYSLNTNYGSASDLLSLVAAVQARGMYMMIDVVANHMGDAAYTDYTPFNAESYFHSYCVISDYTNQTNVEVCRITSDLPDIDTTDTSIRTIFQNWISDLVSTYKIDGLRIDTVKHVEKDFWTGFVNAAGVFAIGEVYHGDPAYIGPYQSYVPGLLNFPMYYSITTAYASKGSFADLVTQHDKVSADCASPELLGTFLDNHDVVRFLNVNSDWTLLKNALSYTLLARGIPILYGGTEQGYTGGADPANREDLWRSGYATTGDLYTWIAKVMAVKTAA